MLAKLFCRSFLFLLLRNCVAPQQRVVHCLLGLHHALTNGFENLCLSQFGDQQAKDVTASIGIGLTSRMRE